MPEKMFKPAEMQTIVDKLKAEGRMPTPEMLDGAIAKAKARAQKRDAEAAKRQPASKPTA